MTRENNKICRVFKALAEPKRYRIVTMLANGKMSASEILKHFNVTQPTLSHDMRLLIDAELVNNQRIGKSVMYELNPEMLQNMIDVLTAIQHPETAGLIPRTRRNENQPQRPSSATKAREGRFFNS